MNIDLEDGPNEVEIHELPAGVWLVIGGWPILISWSQWANLNAAMDEFGAAEKGPDGKRPVIRKP